MYLCTYTNKQLYLLCISMIQINDIFLEANLKHWTVVTNDPNSIIEIRTTYIKILKIKLKQKRIDNYIVNIFNIFSLFCRILTRLASIMS